MSETLGNLVWGGLFVATGAVILHNLEAIVDFDQNSGVRAKAWFNKRLGKSVLNYELWSVGTKSGFRSSRIVFRMAALLFILYGTILIGLSFHIHIL